MSIQLAIFDLDGVLTDTAKYHFEAWKKLAQDFGYNLSEQQNELLKGVNREESLKLILKWADHRLEGDSFWEAMEKKNRDYIALVSRMTKDDLFSGVHRLFHELSASGIKIALGSSSKNALLVLERIGISGAFNAIVDGNDTRYSKPNPEVFLLAAERCNTAPEHCIVVEDAPAGIEAALSAGMKCIGIGASSDLSHAHKVVSHISALSIQDFQ